ncbi:MAG: alpha-L-fucosidase, partial [Phycisphaerae bacterium]
MMTRRICGGLMAAVAGIFALQGMPVLGADAGNVAKDKETVGAEHDMIGAGEDKGNGDHTEAPGAQWFPKAGLGLFLHWGVASVSGRNISWSMIPGRVFSKKKLSESELERVVRERDWDLTGKVPALTPNIYWSDAPKFLPTKFNPDKWCAAAKAAGFEYVVLTTKHHEGFALWPSAYSDFSTKNWAGGVDLVKGFTEACRKHGLKVGLYFSGPDWHFDRDYMSFLYSGGKRMNPGLPSVDGDLNVRTTKHTPEEIAAHQAEFARLVKGEITELLSNYGEIDVIWFDGKPAIPNASEVISAEEIRKMQPGIVINPRLHGHGDYVTYERTMPAKKANPASWGELCNPWTGAWPYTTGEKYRSDAFVLGQLCECRAKGINYLLGIGPMADGELAPAAYEHMGVVAEWMKANGAAVHDVVPLPKGESASVLATAAGDVRYLYAVPAFKGKGMGDADMEEPGAVTMTLKGVGKPVGVRWMGDGGELKWTYGEGEVRVEVPKGRRTRLVD